MMISIKFVRSFLIAIAFLSGSVAAHAQATEQAFLAELNRGMQGDTVATGTVTWTLEQVAKPKQKPELAVRAEIVIPDRNLKLTWWMQRNTGKAAFATHVVAMTVHSPDESHGTIRDLFGMLLRSAADGKSTALFANHEKSGDGMFRSYLAPSDFAASQNDKLLRERSWFELRFTYADGKQGILAMDKGASGERVFAAALEAWGGNRQAAATPYVLGKTDADKAPDPPINFFLAKSDKDVCGPGCKEWIAAEGFFDENTPARLREFLRRIGPGDRPIFFNSLGGDALGGAVVGMILRKFRMRAGVGRTIPDRCPAGMESERCRAIVEGAAVTPSQLKFDAICASACVEAFVGASRRDVAPGAQIAVHRIKVESGTGTPAAILDRYYFLVKQQLVEFGVDPALADLARTIAPQKLRYLTDVELRRFGVVSTPEIETRWTLFDDQRKPPFVLKSITREIASKQHRTDVVRLSCADSDGIAVSYRRELETNVSDDESVVILKAGDDAIALDSAAQPRSGHSLREGVIGIDALDKAARTPAFMIARAIGGKTEEVKLSTAGLAEMLPALRKQCTPKFTDARAAR
jgi:hypothetical protein